MKDAYTNYYNINAAANGVNDGLIYCSKQGIYKNCNIALNDVYSGYYINSGYNKKELPLITCDEKECSLGKVTEKNCSGRVGKIIMEEGQDKTSYKLCISENTEEALSFVNQDNYNGYKNLTLAKIGDFPGSIRKVIGVNISGVESFILNDNTEGQLPICGDICKEKNKFCIKRGDITKIGSMNESKECEPITVDKVHLGDIDNKNADKYVLFFKSDTNNIPNEQLSGIDNFKANKAYECDKSFEECNVVDNGNVIIFEDSGVLTCYSTIGCKVEPLDQEQTIYYLLNKSNCITKFTVCEVTDNNGYLYSCTKNESNKVKCKIIDQIGYYIDGDDLYTCRSVTVTENESETTKVKCQKTTKSPVYTDTICNNNVGKVVFKYDVGDDQANLQTGKYYICSDGKTITELNSKGNEYFISYSSPDSNLKLEADKTYELKENEYAVIKATSLESVIYTTTGNEKKIFNKLIIILIFFFFLFFLSLNLIIYT